MPRGRPPKKASKVLSKPIIGTLEAPEIVRNGKKLESLIAFPEEIKKALTRRGKLATVKPVSEKVGAVLIDWDNLAIPAEADGIPPLELNYKLLGAILKQSLKFVEKAHFLVFATEGTLRANPLLEVDVEELGIELVIVPPEKDAADRKIKEKAEELAAGKNVSFFIFASGDAYFYETVCDLLRSRKKVKMIAYRWDNISQKYNSCFKYVGFEGITYLVDRIN